MLDLLNYASALIVGLLPAMARIVAMVALAPGFSFQAIPAQVRVFLAIAMGLVLAPMARIPAGKLPPSPELFVALLLKEMLVGALIGLIAALAIEAARYAGSFIELQAGLRVAEIFDPAMAVSSSLLGRLYYLAAIVVFFDLRGHHILIAALRRSLAAFPPDSFLFVPSLGQIGVELLAAGFCLAISMAMPCIAALLLVDLSFGLVGRLVTRFNIFFVSLPAKMAVTLATLAISAPLLAHFSASALGIMVKHLLLVAGP